jgi:hypothetical protein
MTTTDKKPIQTVFPREAAALALEKLLATKVKGDRITAREVLETTGFEVDSLRGRIKTWAKRMRLVVVAVPSDGYRIVPDSELVDRAVAGSKSAARKEKENLRVLMTADQSKLDDVEMRRHNFVTPRVAARAARSEQDMKDVKQELKLTERVPLRLLSDK